MSISCTSLRVCRTFMTPKCQTASCDDIISPVSVIWDYKLSEHKHYICVNDLIHLCVSNKVQMMKQIFEYLFYGWDVQRWDVSWLAYCAVTEWWWWCCDASSRTLLFLCELRPLRPKSSANFTPTCVGSDSSNFPWAAGQTEPRPLSVTLAFQTLHGASRCFYIHNTVRGEALSSEWFTNTSASLTPRWCMKLALSSISRTNLRYFSSSLTAKCFQLLDPNHFWSTKWCH